MAKMFYTLEETAEKLGVDQQAVKDMSAEGRLQQFRDRDKLMFKREQVDAMASSGATDISGESSGPIPLADSDDTDAIDLRAETQAPTDRPSRGDTREGTGVSVFEADEVEHADPMAQTQVSRPAVDEDELALDSVGSGSGLLDLTRESDDTSLGAELLDEIYPGGDASDESSRTGTATASGVFEGVSAMDTGMSGPSGLEHLEAGTDAESAAARGPALAPVQYADEAYDPAGSGFGAGMLLGATIALVLGMIVAISALVGVPSTVTGWIAPSTSTLWMWMGGLLVLSLVLGGIGYAVGKGASTSR